jgi:hypothetical protein
MRAGHVVRKASIGERQGFLYRKLRGEPGRKTRFHTYRGALIGPREWLRIPLQVVRGRRGVWPREPWIVHPATRWLGRVAEPDWSALELGAGHSTLWLARRVGTLLTLESDPRWARRVERELEGPAIERCHIERLPVERFPAFVSGLPDGSFDLVFVDHTDVPGTTRADSVAAAREKVRPGGLLVLDDSDRELYAAVDRLLAGWSVRRFAGIKPRRLPLAAETSVYRRSPQTHSQVDLRG